MPGFDGLPSRLRRLNGCMLLWEDVAGNPGSVWIATNWLPLHLEGRGGNHSGLTLRGHLAGAYLPKPLNHLRRIHAMAEDTDEVSVTVHQIDEGGMVHQIVGCSGLLS